MKIVTYNVNGLRQRVLQFGSLRKLLDSFDADIICIQETKLRRQELTSDLAMADGYESFFSCTRTSDKGRIGYSGVATFCRVKSAFSSTEVALPIAADEGFTGLLESSGTVKCGISVDVEEDEDEEEFSRDELLKVDSEGRCVITDHGHFVLFNLYGPRACCDDTDRIQFKRTFYKILEKRWESLLNEGRRVFVVGDLNIAPTAMDRCEAGPDFENNEFRKWLRSILVDNGGRFFDVFRAKHPDRREAYTCWASNSGAEQFNYGSRIDHILCSGGCFHQQFDPVFHNLFTCHVKECNIMTQYKRWKNNADFTPRWKGGLSTKLEGSDHAPVFMSFEENPNILPHSTPSLSARYLPGIRGLQQTLVSMLMKRQVAIPVESCTASGLNSDGDIVSESADGASCCSIDQEPVRAVLETNCLGEFRATCSTTIATGSGCSKPILVNTSKKRNRKNQPSQLCLTSFFQKSPKIANCSQAIDSLSDSLTTQADATGTNRLTNEIPSTEDFKPKRSGLDSLESSQEQDELNISCSKQKLEKKDAALLEWQRIQQVMQSSIPLCKGHKEPCVARVVKKQGPTFGRRFYVCARAEGPSSNPEANCGYFKWASSKSRQKQ